MNCPFQDVDEILGRFGRRVVTTRRLFVSFMSDVKTAKSEEHLFKGGGLIRSAGGTEQLQRMPKKERQMYDERILGDGQFVEAVLQKAEQRCPKNVSTRSKNEERFGIMQAAVCKRLRLGPNSLYLGSRARHVVRARAIVAYIAAHYLGWSGRKLSEILGISPSSVSRGILKGEREVEKLNWDLDRIFD